MKLGLFLILFIFQISQAQEIIFEEEVNLKKNNETEFKNLKAMQPFILNKGESALVYGKNNLPIFFISPESEKSKLTVSSIDLNLLAQEKMSSVIDKNVNEIVDGLKKIDKLILKRSYPQALQQINQIKIKYSSVSTVLFASGTVQYLNNNKTEAVKDLEKGLLINSTEASALSLLEKIKKDLK